MKQFQICKRIDTSSLHICFDTTDSQITQILFMSDKWCTDHNFIVFHQSLNQFFSETIQHVRMVRHDQQFLFITVLHAPCSGAAFYDAFTFQHRSDCSENASHIHKHIQMSHIIAIESCFFTYFQLISSMNLCPSCQSRADIICSIFIAFFQKIILIPECRSWPDYRHISLKNIQKLW